MISKVIFKGLSTTYTYLSIGGIRFFDSEDNIIIESGLIINSFINNCETKQYKVSTNCNALSNLYCPINMINSSLDQTSNYFLTETTSGVNIEIIFKDVLQSVYKIEFVPLPLPYTNNGINNGFTIEFYDEDDNILKKYDVKPIADRGKIQTLNTYELVNFYDYDSYQSIVTTNTSCILGLDRIVKIEVDQNEPINTSIRYIVSFDDEITWKIYRDSKWLILDDITNENIILNGMTKNELELISEKFDVDTNFNVKVAMVTENKHRVPILKRIRVIH